MYIYELKKTSAEPVLSFELGKPPYNAAVQQWELNYRIPLWKNTPVHTQAKKFILNPPTYTRKFLELSRSELQAMVELLTEHCLYQYHLYRMKKSAD